jgi:hypothetical protein
LQALQVHPGDRCAIVCALTRAALPEFPTRVDGVVALERRALTRLAAANE